ncbi:hypothetical protein SEA_NETTUNO_60 [Gordonia phage Nettuno]|nr:hypothetical protein SEA_NETTUNO_60 [Gordonia phage Nettuno]
MSSRYIEPKDPVHSRRMQSLELPEAHGARGAEKVWQSRDFLAVLFRDGDHRRLTVNRTQFDTRTNTWREGISWDELMTVKAECGFADAWAVEVYPPADQTVNVAAMRHLWLLDSAPSYAWKRGDADA